LADAWKTYAVEFRGGLISNLSPLQQGLNAPGSARILRNFEPSVEGGYRRIEGYDKYDSDLIPPYGAPKVHGASQSGTTLIIGNIHQTPVAGDILTFAGGLVDGASQSGTSLTVDGLDVRPSANDTFTIDGDTTVYTISSATALSSTESTLTLSSALVATPANNAVISFRYTIAAGGVSFAAATNRATLTLSQTMLHNPSDQDNVTFVSTTLNYLTLGVASWESQAIVAKNDDIFSTTGTGFTKINVPNYGTTLVNGASQTGTSLIVDGLTAAPQAQDQFTIAGIEKIYTVTATATVSSGGSTLSIDPALASSPADNAALTFISTSREGATRTRFAKYNFNGTQKIALVDGTNAPATYDTSLFTALNDAPADVKGAAFIANFKNALFFGKGTILNFTAPYTDSDFSVANGAGSINVGSPITGLEVFRDQLIIFTEVSIQRLVGNTIADFTLQPVTNDLGCIESDTIQEVGGDIMFLAPDGLRLLSATDRIGDFGLGVVSKNIQDDLVTFISTNTNFTSCVVREKSQYRIFGYNNNITQENAQGILATQFAEQGGANMQYAETRGIRAFVADSNYHLNSEVILFSNNDGYLYQMESGSDFDGTAITISFATPFIPIEDPRVRKTFYKIFLYTDPQGSVAFDLSLKLDFDEAGTVQPAPISIQNVQGVVGFFGTGVFGTTTYGAKLIKLFESQVVGSGFAVSFLFDSATQAPPFSLDALTVEYATNARR
tara:strand:- start:3766 stop:5946 length:2181 start_codon:yes stop_codon:yes gene_type:complete